MGDGECLQDQWRPFRGLYYNCDRQGSSAESCHYNVRTTFFDPSALLGTFIQPAITQVSPVFPLPLLAKILAASFKAVQCYAGSYKPDTGR